MSDKYDQLNALRADTVGQLLGIRDFLVEYGGTVEAMKIACNLAVSSANAYEKRRAAIDAGELRQLDAWTDHQVPCAGNPGHEA